MRRSSSPRKLFDSKSNGQEDICLQDVDTSNTSASGSETVTWTEDNYNMYMDGEEIPRILGLDIRGDEARQGPVYNHARLLTWSQSSRTIIHGFRNVLANVRDYRDCQGVYWDPRLRDEVSTYLIWLMSFCRPREIYKMILTLSGEIKWYCR